MPNPVIPENRAAERSGLSGIPLGAGAKAGFRVAPALRSGLHGMTMQETFDIAAIRTNPDWEKIS